MIRRTTYRCLGLALLAAAAWPAWASPPWLVRTWQSDEGLPDNTVVGIAQTPDGFLWVATKTGLSRFDGLQFQPFPSTAAGAPAGAIEALAADKSGRLWLAKEQGVVLCVDQGRTTRVVGPRQFGEGQGYLSMVVDTAGVVWITYGNDDVLRIQDGQVRFFTTADGLPENGNCHLALDGVGRLWFSRGGWVGVFRDGRFHPLEKLAALRIAGARSGGIWACSGKQFWKCTEDRPLVKFAVDMTVPTATVLYEDRAGSLWLGTREAGLFQLDGTGTVVTASLLQRTVLAVTEDREGSLWVGTRGGGVSQVKPRVVELLTTSSSTPFEPVRSIAQSTDGVLWAVVWPYGEIVRNAGQGWLPLSTNDGWSVINAHCVAADPSGGVWIGTQYLGLKHWQNGTVTESLTLADGLAGIRIIALLASASGDLWIAALSLREQQFLHCRRAGQLRTFSLPLGSGPVVALAEDVAGDCWAATAKGLLLRVHADVLTDETRHTLPDPCAIRSLLVMPDNSLWIGYGGMGLGRLKDGRFTHCRMGQGLHDDYISNLLPDGRGRLWCAGNRGLFSVRIQEFEDFADGRAARVLSVAYQRKEGMTQLQASYDAWPGALRSTDGRLLFAMQSGVAIVYAEDVKEDPEPPSVVI
ncbi:MAG: two-component regulator propeller domain-containing protein, partial [bacterium]